MTAQEMEQQRESTVCASCGGQKMLNMSFCGECLGRLPGRIRLDLWLPWSDSRYAAAVNEALNTLKILRAKPCANLFESL